MGGPTSLIEAIAQGVVVIIFLVLACAEGNPRILRVIDLRRTVIVRRTAQYFAAANYAPSTSNFGGSGRRAAVPQQNRRQSSMGSATVRQSGPGTDLIPLLADNRFLLGVVALLAGVLRASLCLIILVFFDSPHENDITESNKYTDSITLPLAWLTYSLVVALLFAHRDLMSKLKKARDVAIAQQEQQQQQPPAIGGPNLSSAGSYTGAYSSQVNDAVLLEPTAEDGQEEDNKCCGKEGLEGFVLKYRSVLVMILVAGVLVIGEVVEEEKQNKAGEVVSACLSFALGLWALVSTVEAWTTLRNFGRSSQRVIAAIAIATVYLFARGIIVLDPVQKKMCAQTTDAAGKTSTSFWSCAFAFSAVDAVGLALSVLVLP